LCVGGRFQCIADALNKFELFRFCREKADIGQEFSEDGISRSELGPDVSRTWMMMAEGRLQAGNFFVEPVLDFGEIRRQPFDKRCRRLCVESGGSVVLAGCQLGLINVAFEDFENKQAAIE